MGWRRSILTAGALALMTLTSTARADVAGYLAPSSAPDMIRVLPSPPAAKSAADDEDLRAYKATRHLAGSPRWSLAQQDNRGSPEDFFKDFACSLGVTLDTASAPTLNILLLRVIKDARPFIDPAKDHYARKRPYLVIPGDICIDKSASLAKSGSYPSGHSTVSWAVGLIFAQLAPDRTTEILSRARVYSESRVVCGVHYPSDIAAGRLDGSALFSAIEADPQFRADLEKAKAEVAAARAAASSKPDAGMCKVETDAEAQQPW